MIFPGFPAIQDRGGVTNPPVKATPSRSGDASFAEVALGLIESIAPRDAPPAGPLVTGEPKARPVERQAEGNISVFTPRRAPAAFDTHVHNGVVRASVLATLSAPAIASSASNDNSPAGATVPNTTAPVALASSQTQSMFSCVLTPAQYLENAMAEIQSGAPVSSDTPMTVAQVLQQVLKDNYSTPENPYAECSDPAAAAALIARIAGPNANVMVPTVAGMTTPYTPATPAGWVGNYTIGYATQSSGFNDAGETF